MSAGAQHLQVVQQVAQKEVHGVPQMTEHAIADVVGALQPQLLQGQRGHAHLHRVKAKLARERDALTLNSSENTRA